MYKECDSYGEVRIETACKTFLVIRTLKITYIVQYLCYEQNLGILIFFFFLCVSDGYKDQF